VAEVFDGEGDDRRRSVVRVSSPRQPDARFGDVEHFGLRRRSGERGRFRRAVENDARIGRSLDDEVSVPRGLTGVASRLARVEARVRFTKICSYYITSHNYSTYIRARKTDRENSFYKYAV